MRTKQSIKEELNHALAKYYATRDHVINPVLDKQIKELGWALDRIPPWWERD